jgi:chemotaxis protein MotA
MNILSLVGLIGMFTAVVISMFWGGVGVLPFLDIASAFIVIVASIMILVFAGPKMEDGLGVFKIIGMTFKSPDFGQQAILKKFIALSEKARREGLLSLEDEMEDITDEFFQSGLRLAIDGTDKEIIINLLSIELSKMQERHDRKINVLALWGTVAPACGMWGTVMGLIGMMRNLDDPTTVGPNLAIALVTTFYGSVLANGVAIPAAKKLRTYDAEESNMREMVIEGIVSIQSGENTRILTQKLLSFLPPEDRVEFESFLKGT